MEHSRFTAAARAAVLQSMSPSSAAPLSTSKLSTSPGFRSEPVGQGEPSASDSSPISSQFMRSRLYDEAIQHAFDAVNAPVQQSATVYADEQRSAAAPAQLDSVPARGYAAPPPGRRVDSAADVSRASLSSSMDHARAMMAAAALGAQAGRSYASPAPVTPQAVPATRDTTSYGQWASPGLSPGLSPFRDGPSLPGSPSTPAYRGPQAVQFREMGQAQRASAAIGPSQPQAGPVAAGHSVPIFNPRDPHAPVRAAEALYLAHADWRRAAGRGRYDQASPPAVASPAASGHRQHVPGHTHASHAAALLTHCPVPNPYLDPGYAYARVGLPVAGSAGPGHTIVMASLDRLHASGRMGQESRGQGLAMGGALDLLDGLCRRLGVDPSSPLVPELLASRAGHLEQAAIVAAALDSFAQDVCQAVSTHVLGLQQSHGPDGSISYAGSSPVPGSIPARVGLTQATAVLHAALAELAELRRHKYQHAQWQESRKRAGLLSAGGP